MTKQPVIFKENDVTIFFVCKIIDLFKLKQKRVLLGKILLLVILSKTSWICISFFSNDANIEIFFYYLIRIFLPL